MAVTVSYSGKKVIMTAALDEADGKFVPAFFRYVGATTAGHQAILEDQDGNVIFKSEANGANFTDLQPAPGKMKMYTQLVLTTLGSGWVEIFLK